MLSKALKTPTPKAQIDKIEKTCPCGNTFEIVTAQRLGKVTVKRKGWHKRTHCYTCLPRDTSSLEYHRIRERMRYAAKKELLKNGN
jgi:hypothetical protein